MPVGKPDWSYAVENADNEQVADYAELAARLGSIYKHYRTGNYVWGTSFEDSDASYVLLNLGTGTFTDDTAQTQSGANCKKITLASGDISGLFVTRWEAFINYKGLGFQYSIKAQDGNGSHYATIQLVEDLIAYQFSVKYDPATYEWSVKTDSGYVVFTTRMINDRGIDNYYERIKLIIDAESKHYIRLIISGTNYDLSEYYTDGNVTTLNNLAAFTLQFNIPPSGTDVCYIDDLIVTQNEPLT